MSPNAVDPDTGIPSVILTSINTRLVEIKDDVRDVKKHVDEKVSQLTSRVEDLATTFVTKEYLKLHDELWENKLKELAAQVNDLNTDRKKYVGIIVTAVLVAVLAFVVHGRITLQ